MGMTGVVVILLAVCLVLTSLVLGLGLGVLLMVRRRNAQNHPATTTETAPPPDKSTPETMIMLLREIRDNLVSGRAELGILIMSLVVALAGIGIATGNIRILVISQWLLFIAIALNIGIFCFLIVRWWTKRRRVHLKEANK